MRYHIAIAVLLVAGCSSHRSGGIIGQRPVPTSEPIVLVPLSDALRKRVPVIGTGRMMTDAVVAGLRSQGYTVTVVEHGDFDAAVAASGAKLVLSGAVTEWEPDLGVALQLSDIHTHTLVASVDCARGSQDIGSADRNALVPDIAAIALRTLLSPVDQTHLLGL